MPAIVRPSVVLVGCYPIVEVNQKAGIGGLICAIPNLIAGLGCAAISSCALDIGARQVVAVGGFIRSIAAENTTTVVIWATADSAVRIAVLDRAV